MRTWMLRGLKIGVILVAVLLIAASTLLIISKTSIEKGYISTTGTVTAIQGDQNTASTMTITFRAQQAQDETSISFQSSNTLPRHSVGDHVPVVYNSANPQDARVSSVAAIWFYPLLLIWLGLLLAALIIGSALFGRYRERRMQAAL